MLKLNFKILHLNINYLNNKIKLQYINEILNLRIFDIVMLNETRLTEDDPEAFYSKNFII